jgi:hypothetical protein
MKLFPTKGNWGLKILALVLAVVIYFALKNAVRDTPSFIMKGPVSNEPAR